MAQSLTVVDETFNYAVQGESPGWGECNAAWAAKVTCVINNLQNTNDIICTTATIANNKPCATNVGTGVASLSFATTAVKSFKVDYYVTRTDCCCAITVENGQMFGIYNGTSWCFSHDFTGDAGMDFQITNAGQVQYFSDATKGAGSMKYSAKTKS